MNTHWKDWCWNSSTLGGKHLDDGKDWRQKEKRTAEMKWLDGITDLKDSELGQTPGDGEGQGGLVCCRPWGGRVGLDWATEQQFLGNRLRWRSVCGQFTGGPLGINTHRAVTGVDQADRGTDVQQKTCSGSRERSGGRMTLQSCLTLRGVGLGISLESNCSGEPDGSLQLRPFPEMESAEGHQPPALPEAEGLGSWPWGACRATTASTRVKGNQGGQARTTLSKCPVWFSVVSMTVVTLQVLSSCPFFAESLISPNKNRAMWFICYLLYNPERTLLFSYPTHPSTHQNRHGRPSHQNEDKHAFSPSSIPGVLTTFLFLGHYQVNFYWNLHSGYSNHRRRGFFISRCTSEMGLSRLFMKGFPGDSGGKESTCNAGDWIQSLDWDNPLGKRMTTYSSILAWRIPQTGRLYSMGNKHIINSFSDFLLCTFDIY